MPLEETAFPRAYDKDLHAQVRMIQEKWIRLFPTLTYFSLSKETVLSNDNLSKPAGATTLGPDSVSGPSGDACSGSPDSSIADAFGSASCVFKVLKKGEVTPTQFDPLWGESIGENAVLTEWKQPHGSQDVPADTKSVERHYGPFPVHAQVKRDAKKTELQKIGFDEIRDLLVYIPVSILDAFGIVATEGDYFLWDEREYTVVRANSVGYWKNTNIALYVALNCENRRHGA
jgi:hypothetical protein